MQSPPDVVRSSTLRVAIAALLIASGALVVRTAPPAAAQTAALPLGQVSLTGSASACSTMPGHSCQPFKVSSCPNVSVDLPGTFSVSPAPNPQRGVLVMFTPGKGVGFWAEPPGPRWDYLTFAIDQGFQVLQVSWNTGWRESAVGELPPVGPARLACRPASIARYLHEQYWAPLNRPRVPGVCGFCMVGGSGAADQVSYPLTHYGAAAYLDAILPFSGPTHSAMAKTCGRERQDVEYWGSSANDFDTEYGFTSASGPCAMHDPSWVPLWDRDSVSTQGSDYNYPSTRVHLVLGQNDKVQVANTKDFISKLGVTGSPMVEVNTIPGMGHGLSPEGYAALEDALTWDASHGMHACDNGLDDDGDGFVDFAGVDPGCSGLTDPSERDPGGPQCDDGVDNDGDGRADYLSDGGCSGPTDTDERSATVGCDDGQDNDGDGPKDFPADLGCSNPNDAGERTQTGSPYPCDDGVDNDGNGNADFPADSSCASATAYGEGVPPSEPSLSVEPVSQTEGSGANRLAIVKFTLSAAPAREVRVNFATGGGSATAGSDYATRSGSVVWEEGAAAGKQVAFVLIGDLLQEPDETFTVTLSGAENSTLASSTVQVTIVDDDAASGPTIAAGSAQVTERDPGVTDAKCNLTATLSASPTVPVSVAYATTSSGATATAGIDYTARSGTVSWPAGTTRLAKRISVSVLSDELAEPTETFFLDLSDPNPSNVGLEPSRATCTITDDDGGSAGLNIAAVGATTTEADGRTKARCNLKATLSAKPSVPVTVSYATSSVGGTAVAGTDYTAKSGTIQWPAGTKRLTKTIAVPVLSDDVPEGPETFVVDLSNPNPSSTTISPSRATCTINDDD